MTKIKICGIKRLEEAEYLNVLKPDYAGFVFAHSKRQITMKQAKNIREKLDSSIKCVGVFVNEEIQNVINIASYVRLDVIQLHGNEDNEYIRKFKLLYDNNLNENSSKNNQILKQINKPCIWKAIGIMNNSQKNPADSKAHCSADAILVDSASNNSFGGTGKAFNWEIVRNVKQKFANKKIILAGGLNPDNVRDAIKLVKPFAVDVSSGVEENGVKSFEKIKEFILKVRENQ